MERKMAKKFGGVVIGFDLGRDDSQLTFYHQNLAEPVTAELLQTPRDIFSLVEQKVDLGVALLSNFLRDSFAKLNKGELPKNMVVMVTMAKLNNTWAKAIRHALEMLEIPRERIYVQDYQESFYYYILAQKQEYWRNKVALFRYEEDSIIAYEFEMNQKTRPALGTVKKRTRLYLDTKAKEEFAGADWQQTKDKLFLHLMKEVMTGEVFSSAYLVGEVFEEGWLNKSQTFLRSKCPAFVGNNLYTRGACLAALAKIEEGEQPIFLYHGPDMIEHNIGMQMYVAGVVSYQNMITAGIHYCMADSTCEFLLEGTTEVVLESHSIHGESLLHTITLNDLPKRPAKGTRLHMHLDFIQKDRCKVKIDDLGMGEICPSSGKKWEAVLEL